jgi:hypothetical protein
MSYSNDPLKDANRYFDAVNKRDAERQQAEQTFALMFKHEALYKGMDEDSDIDYRMDFTSIGFIDGSNCSIRRRRPSKVGEMMSDILDYKEGPSITDVLAFVVAKAKAGDSDAMKIIDQMARTWAYYKEEV